jgi:CheY-like chemotaxis protein
MHILYVEDNTDVRELIALILEEEGQDVVACANAEDAEAQFARQRFDMLITDVSLPRTRGTELARRLQKDRPDLWVVFCTGYPMQDGAHAWGARARCLNKPFEPEELQALLDECRAGSG